MSKQKSLSAASPELRRALKRLADAADESERAHAEAQVLKMKRAARAPLIQVLKLGAETVVGEIDESSARQLRRSSARLLGRLEAHSESRAVLCGALSDEDAKIRKLSATSLGRLGEAGGSATVEALSARLSSEPMAWVRAAVALALGALGGTSALVALEAHAASETFDAEDKREALAVRQALEKLRPRRARLSWLTTSPEAAWPGDALGMSVSLEVPVGLEDVAQTEAEELGLKTARRERGVLSVLGGVSPWAVWPTLRCARAARLELGSGPEVSLKGPESALEVARWLGTVAAVKAPGRWLMFQGDEASVRYRFSLEGVRVPRRQLSHWLRALRGHLEPLGWVDSPSSYDVMLMVAPGARGEGSRAWLQPSFAGDPRFDYRRRDVGASIDPVVGAGLARLVRTHDEATVLDPTCGSATLLIERAMLGAGPLMGRDHSPTAVQAAHVNLKAAGLKAEVAQHDSARLGGWRACDEVLANLPFGIRTGKGGAGRKGSGRRKESARSHDRSGGASSGGQAGGSLSRLYTSLFNHTLAHVRSGGRVLFYTTARHVLEEAAEAHQGQLKLRERRTIEAGGLSVGCWVWERR